MGRLVRTFAIGTLAFAAFGAARGASDEPRKMYAGEVKADQEISLVSVGWINGSWNKTTPEQVVAYVAGIDGAMCPVEHRNGGGVPYCGLFVQMLPGAHNLKVRISHSAKTTSTYLGWETTFKQDYRDIQADLAADTIYKLVPVRNADGSVDVSLQELCRGKQQSAMKTQFALRDASKEQGPDCP
ncbi:hypothetical protein QO239_19740 [Cupriavidus taiwanensis]|uniref:hypothetical protein n=1 Tax=Cupriavidus taiwanensis TaxID=164546 RepID=UPI00253FA714|nr:hypothetical protein [Cupriavidus taiwanensis]MDK3024827.1 hypothetical protein [Cupriavidus taiwanensis]